jgi:hypothetical protein
MANNWSGGRVIGVMLLLTAGGFVLGMVALCVLWAALYLLGFSPDFWVMTEALATAVAAAAVLGGVILAYRELSEASTTRHIEVADRLFDELNDPASVAARRHVFRKLPADPAAGSTLLTEQDRDAIKHVLNSLDRVAFLTQAGWIPEDMVMPWMSPMILKSWIKLQPWVDYEAGRRQEPEYYRQVRALGERCLAWRKAHGMRTDVTWVENAP